MNRLKRSMGWMVISATLATGWPGGTLGSISAQDSTKPSQANTSGDNSTGNNSTGNGNAPVKSPSNQASQAKKDDIPPARSKYMGRRVAQTMSFHGANWLIRDEREQEERPSQVLPQLGLKPGMTVCDLGCGNGFYSLAMAKTVAPGNVLAVDIQPEMLHLLKLRAEEAKIDNIKPLQGTVIDPQLAPSSVDLVLLVDVYHEFSHPAEMLAAIRQSLKPGGRIALLEYREEDPKVPIKPEHKMSKRQILKEYTANGFKLVQEYDQLPWQHLMFFESDGK